MRMGELAGKEIINIGNGVRLGVIGESDMSIDVESGDIKTIILPRRGKMCIRDSYCWVPAELPEQ